MTSSTQSIKIIFADDSPQFQEGLQLLLSNSSKYKILDCLSNGQELLDSPMLTKADLVLSDIEMPVLNGLEAAKRINYLFPDLPMIAITMYIDKVYLDDIVGAGFKGFIHKPDLYNSLFNIIDKVLNNQFCFPISLKTNNK